MPSDPSDASLPQPLGTTAAETARRGPAKYAAKPTPKQAPARKARPLPTAQPVEESAAEATSVPSAAPRPAPVRPRRPAAAAPTTSPPQSFSPPTESATHRALGRSVATPRNRQRNNVLAVVVLAVAAVVLGVVGIVVLSNRDALFGGPETAAAGGKSDAKGEAQGSAKPAAKAEKIAWTDSSKPINRGDAQVRINSVEIGRPPGASARVPDVLLVTVKVQNTSSAKQLKFIPWSEGTSFEESVRLVDDREKTYGRKVYKKRAAGAASSEGLMPGRVNEIPAADFERDVLDYDGLVLVSFWSSQHDSTQPEPNLQRQRQEHDAAVEQLAVHYADQLRVVKVDVEENRSLARRYDISSFPTLALFRGRELLRTAKDQAARLGIQAVIDHELSSGAAIAEPIAPGEAVEDRLLFDLPAQNARYLRLTLPAQAVGASGTVDFEIPSATIQPAKQPPATERPTVGQPKEPVRPEPNPEPEKPVAEPKPTEKPEPPMEEPGEKVDKGEEEFHKMFEEELSGKEDPMASENNPTDFTKKPAPPIDEKPVPVPAEKKNDRR